MLIHLQWSLKLHISESHVIIDLWLPFFDLASLALLQCPDGRPHVVFLMVYLLWMLLLCCLGFILAENDVFPVGVEQRYELREVDKLVLQQFKTAEVLAVHEQAFRVQ